VERKGRPGRGAPGRSRLWCGCWGREMPMALEGFDHFVADLEPKFLNLEEILK